MNDQFFPKREEIDARTQRRYEEAVVTHILRRMNLDDMKAELRSQQRERTGDGYLTLESFVRETRFPVSLHSRKLPWMHQIHLSDLLQRFGDTTIGQAYLDAEYAPYDDSHLPTALIFPGPGIKFMVVHDHPQRSPAGGTQLVVPCLPRGNRLVLETLDAFLDRIGPPVDWMPEGGAQ
jgi:hypothetical protein